LVILAGGFLALTRFQVQLTRSQAIAMQRAEATLIANQTLNQLIHLPASDSKLTAQLHNSSSGTELPWINGVNAAYEVTWLVVNKSSATPAAFNTSTNCSTACDLKRIDVQINWYDATGMTNKVVISRLMSTR
ncbi:MAG: hypothetical protein K2X63_07075, partial [Burkholderiaceae bacterium]|nr:hypothetical protein [Burkholderiaceae bacterium]